MHIHAQTIITYKNYRFYNESIKETNQTVDKYIYLLSNLETDKLKKLKYLPKYRSSILKHLSPYNVISDINYNFYVANRNREVTDNRMININKYSDFFINMFTPTENYRFKPNSVFTSFLNEYNNYKDKLKNKDELYTHIRIPKNKKVNGKTVYRDLHEPVPELKALQNQAKFILEDVLKLTPHNAAHAYVRKRDNVSNAEQHRFSKHVVNIDLKDFFPSINKHFIARELSRFNHLNIAQVDDAIIKNEEKFLEYHRSFNINEENYDNVNMVYDFTTQLIEAISDLATYQDSLPQGSPLSPTISNLVMFAFDHHIQQRLIKNTKKFSDTTVIYTRYADDLTFSSISPIRLDELKSTVEHMLKKYTTAGLIINENKIKYLKTTNRCFVTGVKLNKDKKATYGHEKKAELKRELFHLFMLFKEGNKDVKQAQETLGRLAYLQRIEPAYAKNMINKYARKFEIKPKDFYNYFVT